MNAQDLVGLLIGEHLDQAGRVAESPGPAIGHERKGAGPIVAARSLELLLGLPDPGDLRARVDDPGYGVEVDMRLLAGDPFGHRDALFLGLVREHRSAHDIADRPDVLEVGPAIAVDRDEAALVEHQAHAFRIQADRVRYAANRDDELLAGQCLRRAGCVGVAHRHAFGLRRHAADLDAQDNLQPLPRERFVRFGRDLGIDDAEECGQRFQDRHLGAEATPDRAHLEADDARADDAQRLRHMVDRERAVVRQDRLLVERGAGQSARIRSGRDDDVLGRQRVRLRARHRDLPAALALFRERAAPVEELDLVLLEEIEDAVIVLLHNGSLARHHLRHVDREVRQADAVIGEMVAGVLEVLGGLQERLRRDAADVGAGAARGRAALVVLPLVDAGGREAELRSADRGDVSAGPGADHDDVKFVGGHVRCRTGVWPDLPTRPSSRPGQARPRDRR